MKLKTHRPLARRPAGAATVPHFIALLGVLHEAAARGLALLPDAPAAGRRVLRRGRTRARFFPALAAGAAH